MDSVPRTDHRGSSGTLTGPDGTLRCPLCAGEITAESGEYGPGRAICSSGRHVIVLADARRAQEYRAAALDSRETARAWQDRAREAAEQARQAAEFADQWHRAAHDAEVYARATAMRPRAAAATAHPASAVPPAAVAPRPMEQSAPSPPAAPLASPREPHKPALPTAVLLQGTGALMILGAAVLISAVAWTILPPTGQALLLMGMVAALGAITVAIKHRVPTTSMILAALTVGVMIVVALGLPAVLPDVNLRIYPAVASAVATVVLLVSGRYGGVMLWRHVGWASVPVTAALFTYLLLAGQPVSIMSWSLAGILLSIQAAALLLVADRQRRSDSETSATAWWAGVAVTLAAAAATAGAAAWTAVGASALAAHERIWTTLAVVALAAASTVAARTSRGVLPRLPATIAAWPTALLPLAVAIMATPPALATAAAALLLPAVVLLELIGGTAVFLRSTEHSQSRAAARGWIFGALLWAPVWLLVTAPAIGTPGDYLWLAGLAVMLSLGGFLAVAGLSLRRGGPVGAGVAIAVAAWTVAWVAGYLGDAVESLTIPILAALLAPGLLGQRRIPSLRLPPLWAPLVTLLLASPTFLIALADYRADAQLQPFRAAAIVAGLALAAALGWRIRGGHTIVAGAAALVAAEFALVTLAQRGIDLIETRTAVLALALAATVGTARSEGVVQRRHAGLAVGVAAFLVPSYLIALGDPLFALDWSIARGTALVVVLAAVAALTWRSYPRTAVASALADLALLAWWWGFWVAGSAYADIVEVWTAPWALLATFGTWLWLRAIPSAPRWSLAVPVAAVLVTSALAAAVTPLGRGGAWDDLRAGVVLSVLWLLTFALWRTPRLAAALGIGAVSLTWYQIVAVATDRLPATPVEVYTWSGAAALAGATALAVRALRRPISTVLSIAPTVTLMFLPTALMAWSTGVVNWRVWFVLVAASAVMVAGIHYRWAGAVYPALLSIAVVLIPVLTRLAQDLPTYVPLTLMGTVLLVIGARLEALRRQGRHFAHWNSRLH